MGERGQAYRRPFVSALPFELLPDTATVGADGSLEIGGCSLVALAEEFGTPLFVYDEAHMRARCRHAVDAFGEGRVIYATKAFLCRAMARLAHEEGLLLDVASGGELHVALVRRRAGRRRARSTATTRASTSCAPRSPAGFATSWSTASTSSTGSTSSTARARRVPDVLLRVTPGVHAHTHHYVATGQDDSKFGFNLNNGDAARAVDRARDSASVNLVGLHCHVGSNVFAAGFFARAAEVMAGFAVPLDLPELVLGGGLGVAYVEGEHAPSLVEWADGRARRLPGRGRALRGERRAGPRHRRRGGRDRVRGRHDQVASPACAPTSPWTGG